MKKVICLLFLCMVFLFNVKVVNASGDVTNVHLIFNKTKFNVGDEIKLSINLENYSNLIETKVMIKCDESVFKPITKNDVYGHLVNNSIYEDILINEYINGYIRFHLIKKDISSGYYSGYKNNVGEFYFIACTNIDNIYDYFMEGSFNLLSSGINITLYDMYNEFISTKVCYSEKIKVNWDVSKYTFEVYSDMVDFLDDIVVLNRSSDQYELLIEEDVSVDKVGSSIINVIIIDKTNADFVLISKGVDIVDTTAPIITGSNNISINSDKIELFLLDEYYQVSDNYDTNLTKVIKYYDIDGNEILSFIELIEYLKHNFSAVVSLYAIDSSNNKSDEFIINLSINDVTSPKIGEISSFEVMDYNLSSFKINDLISISDDYDLNPKLIYSCFVDELEVEDINKYLLKQKNVEVRYYGIDKSLNKTKEYKCILTIKDTTAPDITKLEYIKLNDKEVSKYDFLSKLKISDNIDTSPKVFIEYYSNDVKYEYNNWLDQICTGSTGYLLYYGIDSSNNKTEIIKLELEIIDTTMPIIEVNNVKNGGKYIVGKVINYNVTDNFNSDVDVTVLLNGAIYNKEELTNPGEYTLKIEALDSAGNKNIVIINFKIIENNFIGCGNDIDCYKDNYLEVVILSIILLIVIITIFVIRSLINKKKMKKVVYEDKIKE